MHGGCSNGGVTAENSGSGIINQFVYMIANDEKKEGSNCSDERKRRALYSIHNSASFSLATKALKFTIILGTPRNFSRKREALKSAFDIFDYIVIPVLYIALSKPTMT